MGNDNDYYFLDDVVLNLPDFACPDGWILDFGGGGEGVIGHLKGTNVLAIDRRESELVEALETGCPALPVVMDGKDLKFPPNTIPTATAFFSIMYVPKDDIYEIFKEIYRVLRPGASFWIWDGKLGEIPRDKIASVFRLEITLPSGKVIKTGYGTKKTEQSLELLIEIGEKSGFTVQETHDYGHFFNLVLKKP